ncbi:glycosyltransferase family 4 protein [Thermodesulfobacteriota bacterium]
MTGPSSQPRIAMIIQNIDVIGGAQLNALRLAARLRRIGFPITLVGYGTRESREHLERFSIDPHIPTHFVSPPAGVFRKVSKYFPNIFFLLPCLRILWKHRMEYDILHGPLLMESGLVCGLAALLTRKPSLVKLGSAGRYGDVRRALKGPFQPFRRAVFKHISKFVCLTEEIKDELFQDLRIRPDRFVLIRNGVDTRLFQPGTPEQKLSVRKDLGLAATSKIVICVGRLEEKKRIDFLLKAWQSVVEKKRGAVHLLIVGDGTLRNSLGELSKRLKIADRVTFYGNSENISLLMQGADLFALPSVSEGLANVFLEAMASGLPLVTTHTPGNTEILTHGDNALLFQEENIDELAENIMYLLENEAVTKRMGRSARRTVERHFDVEDIALQYGRLYHGIADKGISERTAQRE